MRYALRNQDKIAAAYSTAYLEYHLLDSLDAFFTGLGDEEELYEYMCDCGGGISYIETRNGSYEVLRINDVADDNAMLEFAMLDTKYDVVKLTFLGRMKG